MSMLWLLFSCVVEVVARSHFGTVLKYFYGYFLRKYYSVALALE